MEKLIKRLIKTWEREKKLTKRLIEMLEYLINKALRN